MTVSRARQMYTHGSWTVPQAKEYLEKRYNKGRLAAELIDQWEKHRWWIRNYSPGGPPSTDFHIPREDLIALISTAYECKGITQLEAARLFRLLGMTVKESRSQLQMVDDNALIIAIFGKTPPPTVPTKEAILDRLAQLMDDPPEPTPAVHEDADLVTDGPTYPNCDDKCMVCESVHCTMFHDDRW